VICTHIIIDLSQQIALNDLETRIEYLEQRNDSLVEDLAQERAKSAEERAKWEARLKRLEATVGKGGRASVDTPVEPEMTEDDKKIAESLEGRLTVS
jgi:hypothetical protein